MKIDKDQFTELVAKHDSIVKILYEMGISSCGKHYDLCYQLIEELHLDISHFIRPRTNNQKKRKNLRSWTDDEIIFAVRESTTITAVVEKLGLHYGSFQTVSRHIKELKLDTSHFCRPKPTGGGRPLNDYLSNRIPVSSGGSLKKRLYDVGLKMPKCEICGIVDWCEKELVFDLDHIDGNPTNNNLENLQILCPNCHSQTPTYKGRNKLKQGVRDRTKYYKGVYRTNKSNK